MNYTELQASEKRAITQALNIKHAIQDLNEKFSKYSEKVFSIVKENGSVVKDKDTITYIAQAQDKKVFDLEKFSQDYPSLYERYLTTTSGAKEHLRYNLK